MKKQILKDFTLTEISGVDRPAQPTAKMTIMKRDSSKEDKKAGSSGDQPDGEKMSDTETKKVTDLEKAVTDLTARLEKADAEAKVAKAVAGLNDIEKAHYESLEEAGKTDFLAKSANDRAKIVKKAAEADETIELNGQAIKKSAVAPEVFAVLKSQADAIAKSEERIAKAEAAAEMTELRKRADDDFGKVLGNTEAKAALLKYLNAAPEDVKKTAFDILKAANETAAFTNIGKSKAEAVDVRKAFDIKVKEIAKRDNISEAKAFEVVMRENPELVTAE